MGTFWDHFARALIVAGLAVTALGIALGVAA